MIDPIIFRAYDIRGIYPQQINEKTAYIIGQSFATYAKEHNIEKVLVGYDNRLSSPTLEKGLIDGLLSAGMNVVRLGLVTTPMFYFARIKLNIWAGIMITASHNPKEYNGFKFSFTNIGNAVGEEIEKFRDFTLKGDYIVGKGEINSYDIKKEYINELIKSLQFGLKKVKVVFDCGNGTCSTIIRDVIKLLPIEYDLLYCDSDGTFPNHHPDPSESKNLVDLQKRVKELNYDVGVAFDADGDRVRIVDNNGNIINSDTLMIIFYRNINLKLRTRKALFDVKCSKSLIDELNKLNIEPIMWRTGNSYLYRKANAEAVDFAGEYSGHMIFRDRFVGIDDGLYAGLRLVEILSNPNNNFVDLLKDINYYYSTDEIKVLVTEENKFEIIAEIKKYAQTQNYNYLDIDGVRINFDYGWALIRASNTGPNLTMRFEAKTKEQLESISKNFTDLINRIKINY